MLLTPLQLQHATTCDKFQVDAALVRAGYSDNGLMGARFVGLNEHFQFIYEIMFKNDDKEFGFDIGRVFLRYFEQPCGIVLLGEF